MGGGSIRFHRVENGRAPTTIIGPGGGPERQESPTSLPLLPNDHDAGNQPSRDGEERPPVNLLRRKPRPLPPSEPLYDDVAWVSPGETAPPVWRRALSGLGLVVLTIVLGVALAIAIGVLLLSGFFLVDYMLG